jgi:hypothetical protein
VVLLPFKKKRNSCTSVDSRVSARALSRSLSVENEWLRGRRAGLKVGKLMGGTGTVRSYELPFVRTFPPIGETSLG